MNAVTALLTRHGGDVDVDVETPGSTPRRSDEAPLDVVADADWTPTDPSRVIRFAVMDGAAGEAEFDAERISDGLRIRLVSTTDAALIARHRCP